MCFIRPEWPELEVPFLNRNTERNLIVSPWSNIDPTHTQLGELIFEGAFLFSCTFVFMRLWYDVVSVFMKQSLCYYNMKAMVIQQSYATSDPWKIECRFRQDFTPLYPLTTPT